MSEELFGITKKYSKPFEYKGRKNKTDFPNLVKILKMTQPELKEYCKGELKRYGYKVVSDDSIDGYLYAKGKAPVLLIAHMDTVHKNVIKDYYEYYDKVKQIHTLSSPQGIGGDDRCGVWTILQILKVGIRPSVLFVENEEIGCLGSQTFCKSKYINDISENIKFMVEIDRRGNNDLVFYEDNNEGWHRYCENITGYKEAYGSYTDICELSEASGVASVNISSGYYNEHTLEETIVVEETLHTVEAVKKMIKDCKNQPQYAYEPITWGWYDDGLYLKDNNSIHPWEVTFLDDIEEGLDDSEVAYGNNKEDAILDFLTRVRPDIPFDYVENIEDAEKYFKKGAKI